MVHDISRELSNVLWVSSVWSITLLQVVGYQFLAPLLEFLIDQFHLIFILHGPMLGLHLFDLLLSQLFLLLVLLGLALLFNFVNALFLAVIHT
jgi:hypothetical protein